MTKIKLQRFGKKHQPEYRIVVISQREKMTARPIEVIGTYNPTATPNALKFDSIRAKYWIEAGAQPTDTVRKLLKLSEV